MELRGCWEPKPTGPEINVLAKVLDEAARVRHARTPVPAYRPDEEPVTLAFVPVEAVTRDGAAPRAGRDADAVPAASPEADGPPPFVIEPDPGWGERTTLFGDADG